MDTANDSAEAAITEAASQITRANRIRRTGTDDSSVCSYAQQRLWVIDHLNSGNAAYNVAGAIRLSGILDELILDDSLREIVRRHDVLRAQFQYSNGELIQVVTNRNILLQKVDLSFLDEAAQREAINRHIDNEARTGFDLSEAPLLRTVLLKCSPNEHLLLLTLHHIVCDGWSIAILAKELTQLYGVYSLNRESPLQDLKFQYSDFAYWQREQEGTKYFRDQLAYWRRQLNGVTAVNLPADRRRTGQGPSRCSSLPFTVGRDLTARLQRISSSNGATLFMTLLTAFQVVLSRFSGSQDVAVGVPIMNRPSDAEGLIGCFLNTLVLRADLSGEPNVRQLLRRVRHTALDAYANRELPFEKLVEELRPERDGNRSPFFSALFAFQAVAPEPLRLPGLNAEILITESTIAKFDLTFYLDLIDGELRGKFEFDNDLFFEEKIRRVRSYVDKVLRAMAENDDQGVMGIPLLDADEQRLVLEEWNATEGEYDSELCIHEIFEKQVARTPDVIAAACGDEALSYAELNARANRLAHHLIELGVRPDDRVAICAERSLEMVIGLLAILKAGGAYVPLDPDYPSDRLDHLLADAARKALLCDAAGSAVLDKYDFSSLPVLRLDQPDLPWSDRPAANPHPHVLGLTSRHLAYVIYTSGSTGMPKGVMNEHRALVNRLTWMQNAYGLDCKDVVLQKTSFGFDVSAWEFFWTLLQGATLVIPPPDAHKDPLQLIELIRRWGVTTIHFVPSMLAAFLASEGVEGCTSLRRLICSGEALSPLLARDCGRKLPAAQLYNLYGPTEAAIDVTAWTCPPAFDGEIVPIGRPIMNLRIYLLDDRQQPAPLGAVGELYIGGVGVARGYLNRPGLTAERFLPDPFSPGDGARMYRTGDLARYLPDGNIEFLGRNDDQVKIRGFRIELGEIEVRLAEHPDVRQAVVVARDDDPGQQYLVAYYIGGASLTAEELRSYLSARLPEYMVPAAFVPMDELPQTPNGKLDRKALPIPANDAYAHHAYKPPQGEMEKALAAIWQELLHVDQVGRNDNFFELGGHSLLAVRMLRRVESILDVRLELSILFNCPQLEAFAKRALVASIEQEFDSDELHKLIVSEQHHG